MFFQPHQSLTIPRTSSGGRVSPILLSHVDRRLNYLYSFFSNPPIEILLSSAGLFLNSSTFTVGEAADCVAGRINPFNPVGYCLYWAGWVGQVLPLIAPTVLHGVASDTLFNDGGSFSAALGPVAAKRNTITITLSSNVFTNMRYRTWGYLYLGSVRLSRYRISSLRSLNGVSSLGRGRYYNKGFGSYLGFFGSTPHLPPLPAPLEIADNSVVFGEAGVMGFNWANLLMRMFLLHVAKIANLRLFANHTINNFKDSIYFLTASAKVYALEAGDGDSTAHLNYEIVVASIRRAMRISLIYFFHDLLPGYALVPRRTNSRLLINFSSMFIGNAYGLAKRAKSTLAVKLLSIRFLRRYLVVFGVKNIALRISGSTSDFKSLWYALVRPLEEIFFHPLGHYLIGDLTFRVSQGGGSGSAAATIKRQAADFFLLQHGKFAPHYEVFLPVDRFAKAWEDFCQKFLFDCVEIGGGKFSRFFWNYYFSCERVFLPTDSLRCVSYRKTTRSVRRRIVKRITRETQRRLWVF